MNNKNKNIKGKDKKQPISYKRARNLIKGSTNFINIINYLSYYTNKS